jgi:hypothetical protein
MSVRWSREKALHGLIAEIEMRFGIGCARCEQEKINTPWTLVVILCRNRGSRMMNVD